MSKNDKVAVSAGDGRVAHSKRSWRHYVTLASLAGAASLLLLSMVLLSAAGGNVPVFLAAAVIATGMVVSESQRMRLLVIPLVLVACLAAWDDHGKGKESADRVWKVKLHAAARAGGTAQPATRPATPQDDR